MLQNRFFRIILNTIKDTAVQIREAQLFMVASSLAYTTILSIIPVLAVSFAIFKAFGGMQRLYSMIEPLILSNLAEGTGEEVVTTLHQFIDNAHTTVVGLGGMVGLVFTSMSMLFSIEKAINFIWKVKVTRAMFSRITSYWLFITLGPLALAVAVGIATSVNLPLGYPIVVCFFFCVYKWVPHAEVRWLYALIASVITSLVWYLARFCYTIYTKNVVTYSAVYGSLGAIPIVLLWIYIVWVIVLGGAALTAALQKRAGI